LNDLVSLLSGRNFEKRTWEEEIAKESFATFSAAVDDFINKVYFERFLMIIQSLGFIEGWMIPQRAAINFAYSLYLYLKTNKILEDWLIEKYVQKWFVFSIMTDRYSSSVETKIEKDMKDIKDKGIEETLKDNELKFLSDNSWEYALPGNFETTSWSAIPSVYMAAICKQRTKGFLSKNISVYDMIQGRGDIHHLYPKAYLECNRFNKNKYNQIANFVYCEQPINIKIGDNAPAVYMKEVVDNFGSADMKLTGITTMEELKANLNEYDIPEIIFDGTADNYEAFLAERRKLMAQRLKRYWEEL